MQLDKLLTRKQSTCISKYILANRETVSRPQLLKFFGITVQEETHKQLNEWIDKELKSLHKAILKRHDSVLVLKKKFEEVDVNYKGLVSAL